MSRSILIKKVKDTTQVVIKNNGITTVTHNVYDLSSIFFDSLNNAISINIGSGITSSKLNFGFDDLEDNFGTTNVEELSDYLSSNDFFKKGSGDGQAYTPTFVANSIFPSVVETDKDNLVEFKGFFLDYITNVEVSANNQNGVSVEIVSTSYSKIIVKLTTNSDEQEYTITLISPTKTENFIIEAESFDLIIPDNNIQSPGLWNKIGANNNSIVGLGSYEAENSNGNGWNEHASFGPVTSSSRLDFGFQVDRVTGASSAYCHILTANFNGPTTGNTPRIYISNATTLLIYPPIGASVQNTINSGDRINIVLEPNKYEIFKNSNSIFVYTGNVSLNNIYMNFTAYRVLKLSQINVKVY